MSTYFYAQLTPASKPVDSEDFYLDKQVMVKVFLNPRTGERVYFVIDQSKEDLCQTSTKSLVSTLLH